MWDHKFYSFANKFAKWGGALERPKKFYENSHKYQRHYATLGRSRVVATEVGQCYDGLDGVYGVLSLLHHQIAK